MVNTEIRMIIFFAAKDGEALYSQQKQDRELTVAQILHALLSRENWFQFRPESASSGEKDFPVNSEQLKCIACVTKLLVDAPIYICYIAPLL